MVWETAPGLIAAVRSLTMSCSPLIVPCEHGNFKAACTCGWRVHPRFKTVSLAEKAWASHARQKMGMGYG